MAYRVWQSNIMTSQEVNLPSGDNIHKLELRETLVSKDVLIVMRNRIGRAQIPVACCATAPYRDSPSGASWDWSDSPSRSFRPWPQMFASS